MDGLMGTAYPGVVTGVNRNGKRGRNAEGYTSRKPVNM